MPKIDSKKAALLALALIGSAPMVGCEKDPNTAGGVGQRIEKAPRPPRPGREGRRQDRQGIAK